MEKDINKKIAKELGKKADEIAQTIIEAEEYLENTKSDNPQNILNKIWDTAKAYGKLEGMAITVDVFKKYTGAKENEETISNI